MAITTTHRGIEYRSRLEARWAAFFTRLGWAFTYEPFDGNGYIPDFTIHGDQPMAVEIKPAATLAEYQAPIDKAVSGLDGLWEHDILILGLSPLPSLPDGTWGQQHQVAGLLGEWFPPMEVIGGGNGNGGHWESATWSFATAHWLRCTCCGRLGVFHEYQSYAGRPCGDHAGDHYMGSNYGSELQAAWSGACNDVKWNGKRA